MQFPCLTMLKKTNDQEQVIAYANWTNQKLEAIQGYLIIAVKFLLTWKTGCFLDA